MRHENVECNVLGSRIDTSTLGRSWLVLDSKKQKVPSGVRLL